MPTFQVDVQKEGAGEFWSNRYYLFGADISGAHVNAIALAAAEAGILFSGFSITKVRTSTLAPNDDQFLVTSLETPGARTALEDVYPLFNVVRVDFSKGAGRPYRKYYRGCIDAANVSGTTITGTNLLDALDNFLDTLSSLENQTAEGEVLAKGVVIPRIAMRQLRRGSRRRTEPII